MSLPKILKYNSPTAFVLKAAENCTENSLKKGLAENSPEEKPASKPDERVLN
jgi:hypothetical protein